MEKKKRIEGEEKGKGGEVRIKKCEQEGQGCGEVRVAHTSQSESAIQPLRPHLQGVE